MDHYFVPWSPSSYIEDPDPSLVAAVVEALGIPWEDIKCVDEEGIDSAIHEPFLGEPVVTDPFPEFEMTSSKEFTIADGTMSTVALGRFRGHPVAVTREWGLSTMWISSRP